MKLFIPITKVDAVQRLVYGTATAEVPDRSGETCDYATTKPYYEKWSAGLAKLTDGKNLGNLRAMHGKVAAGCLKDIGFDDDGKKIEVCAKVVDDAEWAKVLEGVYTGFSQGGRYVKKWKDGDIQRYTAEPTEISLVDMPCLPDATFKMIKDGGREELRKFTSIQSQPEAPTNDALAKRAGEIAVADGKTDKDWASYVEAARTDLTKAATDPVVHEVPLATAEDMTKAAAEPEWSQVWMHPSLKDEHGSPRLFAKKADMIVALGEAEAAAPLAKITAPVDALLGEINEALGKAKPDSKGAEIKGGEEGKGPKASDPKAKNAKGKGPDEHPGALDAPAVKIDTRDDLKKAVDARQLTPVPGAFVERRQLTKAAHLLKAVDLLPPIWEVQKTIEPEGLRKSFYLVSNLCSLMSTLQSWESSYEWDVMVGSEIATKETADRFGGLIAQLGDLVAEILDQCVQSLKGEEAAEAIEASAQISGLAKSMRLMKAGARNSATDLERIKKAHDLMVELGAECGGAEKAQTGDGLKKSLALMTSERDQLRKYVEDTIMPQLGELLTIVKNIENQPAQGALSSLRVVSKSGVEEAGTLDLSKIDLTDENVQKALAAVAVKMAHAGGGRTLLERGR